MPLPMRKTQKPMEALMMKTILIPLTVGLFAAAASPSFAHHTFVMYEQDKELTLSGTVKDYLHVNPHARIELAVAGNGESGPKGGPWVIETESPLVLRKAGITEDTLKPGDRITVRVHPAKDGKKAASLLELEKADGVQISLRERTWRARMMKG
jgi:hypothetical protein